MRELQSSTGICTLVGMGMGMARALTLLALLALPTQAAADAAPGVIDSVLGGERTTVSIDALLDRAELAPGEPARVTELGRDADTSHHLVVLRDREPLHRHDVHALVVVMLRGHGVMHIDGDERPVGPRSLLHVPRGSVHAFINRSDAPAVAYVIYSPPYDGTDRHLEPARSAMPVEPAVPAVPVETQP